jgi:hypothetical protein
VKALEAMHQNDGVVTLAYYAELSARGIEGQIAVALFRAQKRSSRAKQYPRGKWRRAAYDVKSWSMGELARLLTEHASQLSIRWGWKSDPDVVFGAADSYVLYIDLPGCGQCSFHSPARGSGPDYPGEWDGQRRSEERILLFCDRAQRLPSEK